MPVTDSEESDAEGDAFICMDVDLEGQLGDCGGMFSRRVEGLGDAVAAGLVGFLAAVSEMG